MRVVTIDALGTLVRLEPPAPRLRAELHRRLGLDVSDADAERGFRAEAAFYLDHHLDGRDPASLDRLRDRCAAVLAAELRVPEGALPAVRAALLASLRFAPYDDAAPALAALRARGLALVAVSNWDCSLPRVLADAGLAAALDAIVSSAEVGAAKPDPRPFRAALDAGGWAPEEALHVGDSPENDLAGARAAGLRCVLVAREEGAPPGVHAVRSLEELPRLIFGA